MVSPNSNLIVLITYFEIQLIGSYIIICTNKLNCIQVVNFSICNLLKLIKFLSDIYNYPFCLFFTKLLFSASTDFVKYVSYMIVI